MLKCNNNIHYDILWEKKLLLHMVCLHMKTFNFLEDGKEQTDNIYFVTFI